MSEPLSTLEKDRSEVLRQIFHLGDLRPGSIVEVMGRCSKPPDPPIRGGLSRLTCRAVLARPADMGGGSWGESRKVLRFFTGWVGKLLGSFSYAQTHQGFAHRLAVAVRA